MYSEELESAPGSVSQVRACANALMRLGKGKNLPIFIVAHVTKAATLQDQRLLNISLIAFSISPANEITNCGF